MTEEYVENDKVFGGNHACLKLMKQRFVAQLLSRPRSRT